jgi:hypothetical protein
MPHPSEYTVPKGCGANSKLKAHHVAADRNRAEGWDNGRPMVWTSPAAMGRLLLERRQVVGIQQWL